MRERGRAVHHAEKRAEEATVATTEVMREEAGEKGEAASVEGEKEAAAMEAGEKVEAARRWR